MRFHILTLFPEMMKGTLSCSIMGRAIDRKLLEVNVVNIRDYAFNKHHSVDDYPYGGGAGMLMQAEPVFQAYCSLKSRGRVIYLSPQGKIFDQKMAAAFSKEEEIVLLCGHYEGIDQRVLDEIVTDYVSLGNYVVTGGELPALVIVDAVSRLLPGVLSNDSSAIYESFSDGLIEYPQYSRPPMWRGREVPDVLLSGHHANIDKWRRSQSVDRTALCRPELLEEALLTPEEKERVKKILANKEIL